MGLVVGLAVLGLLVGLAVVGVAVRNKVRNTVVSFLVMGAYVGVDMDFYVVGSLHCSTQP